MVDVASPVSEILPLFTCLIKWPNFPFGPWGKKKLAHNVEFDDVCVTPECFTIQEDYNYTTQQHMHMIHITCICQCTKIILVCNDNDNPFFIVR